MSGIVSGLNYLHKNKVIHRDIKPQNIMVHADLTTPVIIDFGTSKEIQGGSTKTVNKGTEIYMAPEVRGCGQNQKGYNETADIYSLGIVLAQILFNLSSVEMCRNLFSENIF